MNKEKDFPKPVFMGVVNVTPNSFSDGGLYMDPQQAIEHGLKLHEEGAQILDIGGESTKPGAEPVEPSEEIRRVIPVIQGLKDCGATLSIDTRHAQTMKVAIDAGVTMVNDVNALQDPDALAVVASSKVAVCLMHMRGDPMTMQSKPKYEDVVSEVFDFLLDRLQICITAGIDKKKIMVDPGIGFGKSLDHNLKLLKNLYVFHGLGVPLMIGTSRKSFIGKITDIESPQARMPGSVASALWAYQEGAQVFRVHDVAETKQAFDVYDAIRRFA